MSQSHHALNGFSSLELIRSMCRARGKGFHFTWA
jgi:hypothetical protein